MKKTLLLAFILLVAVSTFATTSINNFAGYNNGWYPFGDTERSTQTYGEIFTAPEGVNTLTSFSFYTGDPFDSGNIVTGAYIATWTGGHAGTLLFDSGPATYDNVGNEQLTFSTADSVIVTPGQQYIMFLSTSRFHGQSMGSTYVPYGGTDPNLNGFAYFNNGGSFDSVFFNAWDGSGLTPDMAVGLQFDTTPEPGTLLLVGSGILGSVGMLRRKLL